MQLKEVLANDLVDLLVNGRGVCGLNIKTVLERQLVAMIGGVVHPMKSRTL